VVEEDPRARGSTTAARAQQPGSRTRASHDRFRGV
jgi:hypothetical protein